MESQTTTDKVVIFNPTEGGTSEMSMGCWHLLHSPSRRTTQSYLHSPVEEHSARPR